MPEKATPTVIGQLVLKVGVGLILAASVAIVGVLWNLRDQVQKMDTTQGLRFTALEKKVDSLVEHDVTREQIRAMIDQRLLEHLQEDHLRSGGEGK